jgi:hypothetical protein
MNRIGTLKAAVALLVMLGVAAYGYAQHEDKRNEQKPKDQHPAQNEKPAKPDHQAQPQHQGQTQHQTQTQQHQTQTQHQGQAQYQRPVDHPMGGHGQPAWENHRAGHFDVEHRGWVQRGGYHGYRFPDAFFRVNFGVGHGFRIFGLPYMEVGGYPRFQYNGYWFSLAEPYPEYWGDSWYQNDEMYVDFADGGYYLYDRRFPGRPGVAIVVSQ